MDFSITQKNDTRFIYILPFKSNEALVEFTLFSKSILKKPVCQNKNSYFGGSDYFKNYNTKLLKICKK